MTGSIVRFEESPWEGNLVGHSDLEPDSQDDKGMLQEIASDGVWRVQAANALESQSDAVALDVWQALQDSELAGGLEEVVDDEPALKIPPFPSWGPGGRGKELVRSLRLHQGMPSPQSAPVSPVTAVEPSETMGEISFVDLWKRSTLSKPSTSWSHAVPSVVSRSSASLLQPHALAAQELLTQSDAGGAVLDEDAVVGAEEPLVASDSAGNLADLVRNANASMAGKRGLKRLESAESLEIAPKSAFMSPTLAPDFEQVKQALEQQAQESITQSPVGERSVATTDFLIAAALISGVERRLSQSEATSRRESQVEKQPVQLNPAPLVQENPAPVAPKVVQADLSELLAQSLPLALKKALPGMLEEALPGALRRVLPKSTQSVTSRFNELAGSGVVAKDRSVSLLEQRQLQRPWTELWLERSAKSSLNKKPKRNLKGVRFQQLRAAVKGAQLAVDEQSVKQQETSAVSVETRNAEAVFPVLLQASIESKAHDMAETPVIVQVLQADSAAQVEIDSPVVAAPETVNVLVEVETLVVAAPVTVKVLAEADSSVVAAPVTVKVLGGVETPVTIAAIKATVVTPSPVAVKEVVEVSPPQGALVPVESLGQGILHVLGDMAEGIVTVAGRLEPAAAPRQVVAPRFYDRMGGKVYHSAQAIFSGVGGILVGGVGMAFGTVGCLMGAVGSVGRNVVGGRSVTKT